MNPEISLENLHVASPCSASWESMTGSDQVRHCDLCQLNVYNLSGMSRQAAEQLIQEKEGNLCVRYFRREDGTVLTRDCPVGLQAKYQRKLRTKRMRSGLGTAAAVVLMFTAVGVFTATAYATDVRGKMAAPNIAPPPKPAAGEAVQGNMQPVPPKQPCKTEPPKSNPGDHNPGEYEVGKPRYVPPKTPKKK